MMAFVIVIAPVVIFTTLLFAAIIIMMWVAIRARSTSNIILECRYRPSSNDVWRIIMEKQNGDIMVKTLNADIGRVLIFSHKV